MCKGGSAETMVIITTKQRELIKICMNSDLRKCVYPKLSTNLISNLPYFKNKIKLKIEFLTIQYIC